MRGAVAAAVLAWAGMLAVSACGSGQSCYVADYGVAAAGSATPDQALSSVLATHPKWLATHGWVVASRSGHAVTFRSGSDRVDVVKVSAGWIVGGVTACQ